MRIYTAHRRAASLRLVPEGSRGPALLFGPFWLAAHGAWLAAFAVAIVELLLGRAAASQLAPGWAGACLVGLVAGVGIFGQDLRRLELAAGGFVPAGVVAGRSNEEALLRLADRAAPTAGR